MRPALIGVVADAGGGGSGGFDGISGWTDFSEQEDWANPAVGWTGRYAAINTNANTLQRSEIIHVRSLSGKALLIDNHMDGFNGDYRGVVTWDVPGALPAADIEILVLMRAWTNHNHGLGIVEDAAPSAGLYTPSLMQAIAVSAWNTNPRLRDFQKNQASNSWGASLFTDAGAGAAIPAFERYFIRFRLTSAERWRAKMWKHDATEPASWQHDVTDSSFATPLGGFMGVMIANWVSSSSDPLLIEYLSVSTAPDTTPAPMPASLALQGGNFGSVDMANATIDANGFVKRRLANADPTIALEARGGSKHGTVLRMTAAAAGPRAMVTWEPGRNLYNGDVLALFEVAATTTVLGAGVCFPRAPNGSGFYNLSHKSFACLRDFANAVAWMGAKETGTSTDFPLLVNVTGVTITTGERWWVRHRRFMGSTLSTRMKFWKEGEAEPGTWQVDTTGQRQRDPVGTPAVGFDFGSVGGSVYLEHLAWTDDPDENPVDPI